MIESKPGIYCVMNLRKTKYYVGSSYNVDKRLKQHVRDLKDNKHHSSKLQNYYNKHSGIVVLNLLEYAPLEKLIEREQFWIDKLDAYKNGFNCAPIAGCTRGTKRTAEARSKMSAAWTPERKAKVRKGHKLSYEHAAKLAEGRSRAIKSDKAREVARQMCIARTGFKHTEEAKAKMRKAAQNRSAETIDKIRQSAIGRKQSDEARLKMSISRKGKIQSPEHVAKRMAAKAATLLNKKGTK